METAGSALARARMSRVPWPVPVAIGGSWLLAVVAEATGKGRLFSHDALVHSGLPLWGALGLHLLAWQAMVAAMMLPTALPMIRLFANVSRQQQRPGAAMGAFLGSYVLVWTAFGAVAFLGDVRLHRLAHATPWVGAHPWVIAGGTLALAGMFQFSSLKDRCLRECRHPAAFLLQHYRRGVGSAFRLGRRHGLFCLGCCWALMLVGFAAGVANLWWMAALTAIMAYEKVGRRGDLLVPVAGTVLLVLSAIVFIHPAWLPQVFAA
jgi:predicted metal-binding membrane protein